MSITEQKVRNLINGNEVRGTLRFPITGYGEESGGMYFVLREYEYMRPSINQNYTPRPTGNSVMLPMPSNLAPQYSARWGTNEMGAWGSALADPANHDHVKNAMKNIVNSANEGANKAINNFGMTGAMGALRSMVDGVKAAGADVSKMSGLGPGLVTDVITGNNLFSIIGAGQGIARNPFISSLFGGVDFRTFNFSYRLYPRSLDEANEIRSIGKMLKFGMHPSFTSDALGISLPNGLFKYPNIYKPEFTKKNYLFDYGMCVITHLGIDYHSENGPYYFSSNDDKIPAFITLNFSLMEIEIITKETITEFEDSVTRSGSVGR